MKIATPRSLLVALLSLSTTGLLFSAEPLTTSLDKTDQAFVAQAALAGKAEVQVSELAVKKGQSEEVKAIAAMIIEDHKAVNTQIRDLAKTKGLQLTSAGDPDADAIVASLEKSQNGREFDRAYLTQLQKSHKASVASYADAAKDSKDNDVKTWAGLTLVALESHLDRINTAIAAL